MPPPWNPITAPLPGTPRPAYTITDLGTGEPSNINDAGQVVGMFPAGVFPNSKGFPYFHGFLWDKGRRMEMSTFGGQYSFAGIISNQGQILGTASVPGRTAQGIPIEHRCLWQNGKLTDLETDPRFRGTGLLHFTKSGGLYAVSPPTGEGKLLHLWFFPHGFGPGERQDKGILGGPSLKPTAINDSSIVVGMQELGPEPSLKHPGKQPVHRAFMWQRGHLVDMGTLGGVNSQATAVNSSGQVVGTSELKETITKPWVGGHAFLWDQGKMHDLGALVSGGFSYPCAINSAGQIAGFSDAAERGVQLDPVLWRNGRITDLSRLIPAGTRWISLSGASSINDRGQIVGDGSMQGEHWIHSYLLSPIGYKAGTGEYTNGRHNESSANP